MVSIFELTQLTPKELLYQFFLPFILTFVIFFAVLEMLPLFSRKINLILSIVITILIAASPLFAWIVELISVYGAFTALGAFLAVFVIGVAAWAFRRSREYVTGESEDYRDIRRLDKEIAKDERKLREARRKRDERKIRELEDQLERKYRRRWVLERTASRHI